MIFIIILCILSLLVASSIDVILGGIIYFTQIILFGLMVVSFNRYPKSKWTLWWNKDWKIGKDI